MITNLSSLEAPPCQLLHRLVRPASHDPSFGERDRSELGVGSGSDGTSPHTLSQIPPAHSLFSILLDSRWPRQVGRWFLGFVSAESQLRRLAGGGERKKT